MAERDQISNIAFLILLDKERFSYVKLPLKRKEY